MITRILLPIAIFLFLPFTIYPQSISGRVLESESKTPLYGAHVQIRNTQAGAFTDRSGYFKIEKPAGVDDMLIVSYIGYKSEQVLFGEIDSLYDIVIYLQPKVVPLDEIVITSTRPPQNLRYIAGSVDVIQSKQLEGTRSHYMDDALLLIPGVHVHSRHNQDEARISIRGSGIRTNWGVRGITVLINDIPLTDADGLTDIDAIDLGLVDRVEVLRGPASALYGNGALGGVINFIKLPDVKPFSIKFSGNYGSYGFQRYSTMMSGTNEFANYFIGASYHLKSGYREQSGGDSQRIYGALTFYPDEISELRLLAFWRAINFDLPGSLTYDEFQSNPQQASGAALTNRWRKEKTRSRLGLSYNRRFSSNFSITTSGYYGEHTTPYHPIFMVLEEDFRTTGGDARILYTSHPNLFHKIVAGVSSDYITGHARYYINEGGERGELQRNEQINVSKSGFYFQYEYNPISWFILTTGARFDLIQYRFSDYRSDTRFNNSYNKFTPQIGILIEPYKKFVLYLQYATGFETPAITEIRGADFTLSPIEARNYEIGVHYSLNVHTTFSIAAFDLNIRNDIIPYTVGFQTKYRNAAQTRHGGVEVAMRSTPAPYFSANVAYTFSHFRFIKDGEHGGKSVPGISPHRISSGIQFRLPAGFTLGGRLLWNDRFYLNDANTDSHSSYLLASLYTRWQRNSFSITLSVENLFDERYASFVRINETNRRYFEPGDGRGVFLEVEVKY